MSDAGSLAARDRLAEIEGRYPPASAFGPRIKLDIDWLINRVRELEAENAQYKADAKRIEWLEVRDFFIHRVPNLFREDDDGWVVDAGEGPDQEYAGHTFREAVDWAIKSEAARAASPDSESAPQ